MLHRHLARHFILNLGCLRVGGGSEYDTLGITTDCFEVWALYVVLITL
mgnify:CR=1 FL=1